MKFGIKIMPRDVILDVQGRAVEDTLKRDHFQLQSCRVGKYVEVVVPEQSEDQALKNVQKMTEHVLYNPLIETAEVKRIQE